VVGSGAVYLIDMRWKNHTPNLPEGEEVNIGSPPQDERSRVVILFKNPIINGI
jgi:hypothetical protein